MPLYWLIKRDFYLYEKKNKKKSLSSFTFFYFKSKFNSSEDVQCSPMRFGKRNSLEEEDYDYNLDLELDVQKEN